MVVVQLDSYLNTVEARLRKAGFTCHRGLDPERWRRRLEQHLGQLLSAGYRCQARNLRQAVNDSRLGLAVARTAFTVINRVGPLRRRMTRGIAA